MKKVGIATFVHTYNYGSVLQAYALTEYINSLGYYAEIIDYLRMEEKHNRKTRYRLLAGRFLTSIRYPTLILSELKRIRGQKDELYSVSEEKKSNFDSFEAEQMKISTDNYYLDELYDAFICGSDQVWQLHSAGLHNLFFLRFAPKKKRIAYAPSFGTDQVPSFNKNQLKRYLEDIAFLSAREESGVEIIKNITGKKAPQVLDPVLLIGAEFWKSKFKNNFMNSTDYILCYFLDNNKIGMNQAKDIAKKFNYEIIIIGESIENTNPDPIEFVELIKNAKLVLTDSFHGVAFSTLMNTDFCVFERNYNINSKQSTRIVSYLNVVSLKNNMFHSSMDIDTIFNTDFQECNNRLEEEREKSRKYLEDALLITISGG